ncbi:MAG: hypothetical protein JO022_06235 [Acidobacteriaceae bacterium]|nr:hypothetical protein [Acidobacteriaceae bacterium]
MKHIYFPLLLSLLPVQAQTTPKEKASDYPVHQKVATMELAAEYLVHSIPSPRGSLFARDYLVVEVAGYPSSASPAAWKTEQFVLRINRKRLLRTEAAQMVAQSFKYGDIDRVPRVIGSAGAGNGGVIFGQPPNPGRFPGDPNATGTDPTRQIPRVPDQNPSGQEPIQETPPEVLCVHLALQDGPFAKPSGGLLYFPFSGKLKSIKTLELIFESPDGTKATLPLL